MSKRNHVVITGTGRAGTTFLVELLTYLNVETGFSEKDLEVKKNQISKAGLEFDIRDNNCPFIVKSPWFCDYAEEVIYDGNVSIKHIFVPIRGLYEAAESRRYVSRQNVMEGGLWHTDSYESGKQEEILMRQIYKLLFAVSDTMIPVTLMRYPRIVNDCSYLYHKLKPMSYLQNSRYANSSTHLSCNKRLKYNQHISKL